MMDIEQKRRNKMRSQDRVLVLEAEEGKKALSTKGLIDPRLFTGDNDLHAVMDKQTCLWHLKYEKGIVPPSFQQRFTSFRKLKEFADEHYQKRNIIIKEVKD